MSENSLLQFSISLMPVLVTIIISFMLRYGDKRNLVDPTHDVLRTLIMGDFKKKEWECPECCELFVLPFTRITLMRSSFTGSVTSLFASLLAGGMIVFLRQPWSFVIYFVIFVVMGLMLARVYLERYTYHWWENVALRLPIFVAFAGINAAFLHLKEVVAYVFESPWLVLIRASDILLVMIIGGVGFIVSYFMIRRFDRKGGSTKRQIQRIIDRPNRIIDGPARAEVKFVGGTAEEWVTEIACRTGTDSHTYEKVKKDLDVLLYQGKNLRPGIQTKSGSDDKVNCKLTYLIGKEGRSISQFAVSEP